MVNLRKCILGQKLVTKRGKIVTYLRRGTRKEKDSNGKIKTEEIKDTHIIRFDSGAFGIRTDKGKMYRIKELDGIDDIIKILPVDKNKIQDIEGQQVRSEES